MTSDVSLGQHWDRDSHSQRVAAIGSAQVRGNGDEDNEYEEEDSGWWTTVDAVSETASSANSDTPRFAREEVWAGGMR
jgi:hypothetical protein